MFAEPFAALTQVIVSCREAEILESLFNWGGLFNQYYRVGTGYYEGLQIERGQFFNLIVQEATDNGFSLYDINELDHAILLLLSKPLSINEVLIKMQLYFEEDVLQNYYEVYKELILTSTQQLVIKKAIQSVLFCRPAPTYP